MSFYSPCDIFQGQCATTPHSVSFVGGSPVSFQALADPGSGCRVGFVCVLFDLTRVIISPPPEPVVERADLWRANAPVAGGNHAGRVVVDPPQMSGPGSGGDMLDVPPAGPPAIPIDEGGIGDGSRQPQGVPTVPEPRTFELLTVALGALAALWRARARAD